MLTVNFPSWLVGFIEGEGSFSSNRGCYPVFSLAQKDESIMVKIREFLGAGIVYFQPSKHAWQYSAYGNTCIPLRNLCEGKLLLKKKCCQFEHWKQLRWPAAPGHMVINTALQEGLIFEDWLLGFFEAEGSFTSLYSGIYPEFSISQNEREILERIRDFFGCGQISQTGNKAAWQLRITGRDRCEKVRDFCEGKLQSQSRQIQFEGWKKLKWDRAFKPQIIHQPPAQQPAYHQVFVGVKADGMREVFDLKM